MGGGCRRVKRECLTYVPFRRFGRHHLLHMASSSTSASNCAALHNLAYLASLTHLKPAHIILARQCCDVPLYKQSRLKPRKVSTEVPFVLLDAPMGKSCACVRLQGFRCEYKDA